MVVSKNSAYCKAFIFLAAFLARAGASHALATVSYMSPATQYINNSTTIDLRFKFTSNTSTNMTCTVYLNNSTTPTTFWSPGAVSGLANDTETNLTVALADDTFTWLVNCTNLTSGEYNSSNTSAALRSFTLDTTAPTLSYLNYTDPDGFYSYYTSATETNAIIHLSANITNSSELTGVTIYANFSNVSNGVCGSDWTALAWSGAQKLYNASCNVTLLAANLSNGATPSQYTIPVYAIDAANNTATGYSVSVLLHNLGLPSAGSSACMQFNASTSTNMSKVLNFSSINLQLYYDLNGSSACMGGTAAPWGSVFKEVMYMNFSSLDLSTAAKAAQLASLSTAINVSIAPPRTFGYSRIFVDSAAFTQLNTTTNITFYDLPLASTPGIAGDAGTGSVTSSWSQGGYSATFQARTGNLTMTVGNFSGYNTSDFVAPALGILEPSNHYNTTNATLVINVSANGTGSQVSLLNITLTNSAGSATSYTYSNVTGTNTAGCVMLPSGSDTNVSCQVNVAVAEGYYTLNVSATDYGNSSGNTNSVQRDFTIDRSGPTITVNWPLNNTNVTEANVSFNWTTAEQLTPNSTCNMSTNVGQTTYNYTDVAMTNGSVMSKYSNGTSNFANGTYNWSLQCWDGLGNIADTGTLWFAIAPTANTGNASNVTSTSTGRVNVSINGTAVGESGGAYNSTYVVNVSTSQGNVLSFAYNFSVAGLNFSQINITNGTTGGASYMVVNGLNTTGAVSWRKNITIYGVSTSYNGICILSREGVSIGSMSSGCSDSNNGEFGLICDGRVGNDVWCTRSDTTLYIYNLLHSAVRQQTFTSGSSGSGSTGGGSGGSMGGSTGSSPESSSNTADYLLDVGSKQCKVTLSRDMESTTNLSTLTTTLVNAGGEECRMSEFSFSDTISDSFAAMNEITFTPAYSLREGWKAIFSFPSFAPGESKTITYSVARWARTSSLANFTIYSMSAKAPVAAPQPPAQNATQPPKNETVVGNDRDSHGCIGSAGYTWCEAKKKCLRTWKEPCSAAAPTTTPTQGGSTSAPEQKQDWLSSGIVLAAIGIGLLLVIGAVAFLVFGRKRRGL